MAIYFFLGVLLILALIVAYILYQIRIEKVSEDDPAVSETVTPEEAGLGEMIELLEDNPKKEDGDPYQQLYDAPQFDPLCELKTGMAYLLDCQQALNQACESSSKWAVAWLDLDRFRFINSLKGMSIGDYALTNFAVQAQAVFPPGSLLTRISADHFSACFPLMDDSLLQEYADQLRRICDKIRSDIGVKSGLHICMGICLTGDTPESYAHDVMLQKANIARHCLKGSKTEIFSIYNDTMASSYLYGESSLDDFSDYQYDEEIIAYFQPQSDILKNRIVGAQALSRWAFEEIAHVKSRPFHPENGRLPSNARRMIYQVCRTVSRWRKAGKEVLPVFIHLPPTELFREDIDEFALRCASEFQLEPYLLTLVVDIVSFIISPDATRRQIKKLHETGCVVAVEGNIYLPGRLELLQGLPVTYVKVPRALNKGIDKDESKCSILSDLRRQIQELGMQPVHEGVDETAIKNIIERLGGGIVEGRYSGRPIVGDDFAKVLKEFVQKQRIIGDNTVILDDKELRSGEYNVY